MLRAEKEKTVQELVEKFQNAQGVYLADYMGLDVASITDLRRKLRNANVEFFVVKNTLAKLAAEQAGIPELKDSFEGPTSLAFGYDDPIEPARVLVDFARKHKRPQIRSGMLEGQFLSAEQVAEVAALPSRDELLAKVAMLVQSPLTGFVYQCHGLLQKLVATLDAYRMKREEDAPEGDAAKTEEVIEVAAEAEAESNGDAAQVEQEASEEQPTVAEKTSVEDGEEKAETVAEEVRQEDSETEEVKTETEVKPTEEAQEEEKGKGKTSSS